MGYPVGYYNMGTTPAKVEYAKKMKAKRMMKMDKKMSGYHDMNGYQMRGDKHHGPEGYWGI